MKNILEKYIELSSSRKKELLSELNSIIIQSVVSNYLDDDKTQEILDRLEQQKTNRIIMIDDVVYRVSDIQYNEIVEYRMNNRDEFVVYDWITNQSNHFEKIGYISMNIQC